VGQTALYPLRFESLYQYRLWGGRRVANLLSAPLPGGPIGDAWVLSDRDDHASTVDNNDPLKGQTISELMGEYPEQLMGKLAGRFQRFPLLLKFLDAQETFSVQVRPGFPPSRPLPEGETAKTEAWGGDRRGERQSHLCRAQTRRYLRHTSAIDRDRNAGGPNRILHAEVR
jgi:mannose-6-phosphate isomerase